MVSLVSIGIEKYDENQEFGLERIPCAFSDAEKVYHTFEKVLGLELKKHTSVSVKDITALECKALLSAMQLAIEKEDIFIYYFSGHGIMNSNGKLRLAFRDYTYGEEKGSIAVSELTSILSCYHCTVVLILDCCYSGAGLVEINNDDVKLENSISLLASGRPMAKARYNKEGSLFTAALCSTLERMDGMGEEISLDHIFHAMKAEYDGCQTATGGGNADIVLKKAGQSDIPQDFVEKFVNKIDSSNYEMREALWYSLGYFPEAFRIKVLSRYNSGHGKTINEMSWRVRRAIGSICRYNVTSAGEAYLKNLLASKSWMDRCVGLIAVHKREDEWITRKMQEELTGEGTPMDLVWLTVLYLSEREWQGKEAVLDTKLMETTWGATEIWKRYFGECPPEERRKLFQDKMRKENYKNFCLELYFRGEYENINLEDYPQEIRDWEEAIRKLYAGKRRGRIKDSRMNKWIFSVLYGNWRDQIDLNTILEEQFGDLRPVKKKEFLNALQYIPSVEIKMAVLDFFATKQKERRFAGCREHLRWALCDEHPWVIRTAIPLFAGEPQLIADIIRRGINIDIYPGVFDLAIELRKHRIADFEYEVENMTDTEAAQLQRAINNE